MDNLETNTEPVGAEGATSSQDNFSATETQPAETPEVVSANEGTETGSTGNPWDSDPRFKGKTAEEMFNIVQEADKYKGVLSQKAQVIELLERQTGIPADQLAQVLQEQEEARLQAEYAANPASYALKEVTELKAQLAYQEEQRQVEDFVKNNPEYSEFKNEILNLGLNLERDKSYEDIAKQYFGKAIAKGQESAYQKIEVKKQTQSTGTSTATQKPLGYDQMKDLPRSERIKLFEQMVQ